MKTQKVVIVLALCMALLNLNCSSDDDGGSSQQVTNIDLLTSGKWYFETRTPGSLDDCDKTSYIQFMDNGTLTLEIFETDMSNCESTGVTNANYTLTNDVNLILTLGSESQSAIINSISSSELRLTNLDTGEVNSFDKTSG